MGKKEKLRIVKKSERGETRKADSVRRLVAIMFTDVAGFSSMMGRDEEGTFKLMALNKVIQKSLVNKYGGSWIKEMGDGYLSIFDNASDAVRCARQILLKTTEESELSLKTGIHLGEIIQSGSDVMGDGVNIASRIVSACPADDIWVSESVYFNLRNKPDLSFGQVGERWFKNIDQPIMVYKVTDSRQNTDVPGKSDKIRIGIGEIRIGPGVTPGYLPDDLILTKLSQYEKIEVMSPAVIRSLDQDMIQSAAKMGVRYLLEGSLNELDGDYRLYIHLSDLKGGSVIRTEIITLDQKKPDMSALEPLITSLIEKLKKN